MSVREVVFAALLACAAGLIVIGVSRIYEPAAWIAAGPLLALWAWAVVGDIE